MAYMFLNNAQVAVSMAVIGKILFFVGIGMTATLGIHVEKERLRLSSWREIISGVVPEHLRTRTLEAKDQIVPTVLSLLLFAIIFYTAGDEPTAVILLALGAMFWVYYSRRA
jgi:hypothetical protein